MYKRTVRHRRSLIFLKRTLSNASGSFLSPNRPTLVPTYLPDCWKPIAQPGAALENASSSEFEPTPSGALKTKTKGATKPNQKVT